MTDTTVRCFLSVCETLNFTRSAELLFMSQQAVSKQINALEQELGYQLLIRGKRGAELTEIGSLYYRLFSRWIVDLQETRSAAARIAGESMITVRIGYLTRVKLPDCINQVIHQYKLDNPVSRIDYSQLPGSQVLSFLKQGLIDIGITHGFFGENDPELESVNVYDVKRLIAISEYHPLYSDPLDPALIPKMTYLYELMENNNEEAERNKMLKEFKVFGAHPETMKQVKTHEELELAVQMGEGLTSCSDITFLPSRDQIHVYDTGFRSQLVVSWRKNERKSEVRQIIKAFKSIAI